MFCGNQTRPLIPHHPFTLSPMHRTSCFPALRGVHALGPTRKASLMCGLAGCRRPAVRLQPRRTASRCCAPSPHRPTHRPIAPSVAPSPHPSPSTTSTSDQETRDGVKKRSSRSCSVQAAPDLPWSVLSRACSWNGKWFTFSRLSCARQQEE